MLIAAACALLTSAEIAAVQGARPSSVKESAREGAGLRAEQCFFTLPRFSDSVSLEVTRGSGVTALWRKTFHEEHAEEEAPAQRVRRLGDEAFWVGDPRLGGLYVLRKRAMLRIAVGGTAGKAEKLRRLTRLAKKALRRL